MLSTAPASIIAALDDFLKDFDNETVLSLSVKHFTEDPLVLTVAARRRWINQDTIDRWPTSLDSVPTVPEDREVADRIREYYKNKILLRKLKTAEVTQFYQDLYGVITDSVITEKHLGMLYRLPYFYYEDQERDQLREYFDSKGKMSLSSPHLYEIDSKHLTPVKTLMRCRRGSERVEFWFETSEGLPVMIPVDSNNSLLELMHSIFDNGNIEMSGYYKPTTMRGYDDFVFYNLLKPSMSKRIR